MRVLLLTVTFAALGCGSNKGDKGDDCQQVVANSKFGIKQMAQKSGGAMSEKDVEAKLLEACRFGKEHGDAIAKCDALKDEDAKMKCYSDVLDSKK